MFLSSHFLLEFHEIFSIKSRNKYSLFDLYCHIILYLLFFKTRFKHSWVFFPTKKL